MSTVGYGDLYAVTDAGRMFMVCVIIIAVYNVPRLVNDFTVITAESAKSDRELEQKQEARERGIAGNNHDHVPLDEKLGQSDDVGLIAGQIAIHDRLQQYDDSELFDSDTELSNDELPHSTNHSHQHHNIFDPSSIDQATILAWCELNLLRHHSVDDIISLCEPWSIDTSNRSDVSRLLVTKMFTGTTKSLADTTQSNNKADDTALQLASLDAYNHSPTLSPQLIQRHQSIRSSKHYTEPSECNLNTSTVLHSPSFNRNRSYTAINIPNTGEMSQ